MITIRRGPLARGLKRLMAGDRGKQINDNHYRQKHRLVGTG
jgi:hypothetical protein